MALDDESSISLPELDPKILLSAVEHVFLPPKLPQYAPPEGTGVEINVAFCQILIQAAQAFSQGLSPIQQSLWTRMIKMMESIHQAVKSPPGKAELKGTLSNLTAGDVFLMHVRAQNAAIVVRVYSDHVRFEIFEVSQQTDRVTSTEGKLLCSFPGPAVRISSDVFSNEPFLRELVSFLIQMDADVFDSCAPILRNEYGPYNVLCQIRDTAHPRYISELLVGILRGFGGQPVSVDRITKRIGDDVLRKHAHQPWRRSPIWLAIRVALQTSMDSAMYKGFILFFHAHLLQICIQRSFPSESLHLMRVKMARRLSKLGLAVSDHVHGAVYDAATKTETLLQQRWSDFQESQSVSPPWRPEEPGVIRDTTISLKNSRSYLVNALSPTSDSYSQKKFNPSHPPRLLDTVDFNLFSEGKLTEAIAADQLTALADFESSVERYLDTWVDTHYRDDNAPDVIASCVEQYYASAKDIYNVFPEDKSVMILTILNLWMALDTLTIRQCPLLGFYSPEIPQDFLHPLLLHRSNFLRRATLIEGYISQRHEEASIETNIFSDDTTESSFAVRYFRDSLSLKQLFADINRHARKEQEKKRAELGVLNDKWKSLKDTASNMSHNYIKDEVGDEFHEPSACQKCTTDSQADELKIDVFEWPLPRETLQAQAVVFELSPPRAFSAWREITYKILFEIGMSHRPYSPDLVGQPPLLLDTMSGLSHWAVRHSYHRITIGFTTPKESASVLDQPAYKPEHHDNVQIPATETSVLLNIRLTFNLYDRNSQSWAARPSVQPSIKNFCAPPISLSSPYANIQSYVSETDHTSNEVIAAQADCPPELSLHEYMAFSVLRSGPRLQWLNIARELSSPSLSFRREEVHTLITQAAWQLGPLSDGAREWHTDLGMPSFGKTLLHELEDLLGRVAANWLEEVTIRTIALITSRLLTSANDRDTCERAHLLLRKARNIAYEWIKEIHSKLDVTEDETSRANLRLQLCTLAATCFSTYDVSLEHVSRALASDDDIATAVHCAVLVHDNSPTPDHYDDDSRYLTRLLNRHHRLTHFLESFLHEVVLQSNPSAFDQGVTRLWPGFCREESSDWHMLPSPNSRWISCTVKSGQEVHFNLLTGSLLIGGNPLGRLPQKIIQHIMYERVLGKRIFDVVPASANVPWMEFMTRSSVSGYQIFFALRNRDLIIQARRQEDPSSQLLQLVPQAVFVGDFPRPLVDDYVHWLDLDTGEVEFRPDESPWASDPSNWQLKIHTDDTPSVCRKTSGDSAPVDLIDIRSPTFHMLSHLLYALESPEHIIITSTSEGLEAVLNRLRLAFFVNQNSELECRSMQGYVIDESRSCGTMFGLKNKLVLRPSDKSSEMPRRVIIPQGEIKFRLDGDFPSVSIKTGSAEHVHWYEYTIDDDLGRLSGNVSLQSRLYQCYLHALTSHCLPDPLLGHTGTEESLNMLQSAAFLSFQRLSKDDAKLLHWIGDLTPKRVSNQSESTVRIKWKRLPILSQHYDFHPVVLSIFSHANAVEALYDDPVRFLNSYRETSFLNRMASRNNMYYPQDLQSSKYSSISKDDVYTSRDIVNKGSAEFVSYQTSWSVWNNRPCLPHKRRELWDIIEGWGSLGPAEEGFTLQYSRYWLNFDPSKDWLRIYELCQKALNADPQDTRIRLAFSLSAASFGETGGGTNYPSIVPLVLIFATDTRFRDLVSPSRTHYDLSVGAYPDRASLIHLMTQCALPLEETPAQTMEVQATTSENGAQEERQREYKRRISEEVSKAAQSTMERWPEIWCDLPHQWFDTQRCKEKVEVYLERISPNGSLRDHIVLLQAILTHYSSRSPPRQRYVFSPKCRASQSKAKIPSLRDVLASRKISPRPPTNEDPPSVPVISSIETTAVKPDTPSTPSTPGAGKGGGLSSLIEELRQSEELLLKLYGEDLGRSYTAMVAKGESSLVQRSVPPKVPPHEALLRYHDLCSKQKDAVFSQLSKALGPSQKLENVLSLSSLWPRITPRSILRQLSRECVHKLTDQWKHAITRYAVAFLKYQQSRRLLELSSRHWDEELLREMDTVCEDVTAASSPDWLLIQIDTNFLARPLQLAISREMISPTCRRSASLQLNMGEGKTSVIVPLVAATLADGSKLARIVTLKPLSTQMFQILLNRLSYLANRRIYYAPFSRKLKMSNTVIKRITGLYKTCAAEGGVLVVQPEHLLSQKLTCINALLASQDDPEKLTKANELKALLGWLAKVSRDVLDESDEILHVRNQLVYTSGEEMSVEDHPNRWYTTQQVFNQLRAHAAQLVVNYPHMLELDQTQKGFPTIRILNQEVSQRISSLIADDALRGALSTLSLAVLSPPIRAATRRFIIQKEISAEDHQLIRSHFPGTTLWSGILLLRGLLVEGEGVLAYVLKERRWRVDFGLDLNRTLLAVPYRGKDVPSSRAEFGHPDVAIALTCLSYYYGGLTREQVLECFDLLVKLDNPDLEYDQWVEFGEDIPTSLRQVNGVNTKDDTQIDEQLVPLFSRNTRVIDFYLSRAVFPRAAKGFPSKLTTSAWDLVEAKSHVTTGFSGTNDNRYLLPTSISQEDPVSQLSTNALVLQYLLQPENNYYECTEGINGEREHAEDFLRRLIGKKPEIQVLLDVGAQMLELQNEELARYWLSLKPEISAAIFFNESDDLTVLAQDGTIEPLIASPFNRKLDKCIVYFDDAHTRGTDLKLPKEARAAVTLGPKVAKDKLLQGCMRMRQLGKGQSVMFFAPGDVHRRIQALMPTGQESNDVQVVDILRWALHETCLDIAHYLPHWAQQGVDHHRRFSAYRKYNWRGKINVLRKFWLQPESKSLEEMYEPVSRAEGDGLGAGIRRTPSLRRRLNRLGITRLTDVRMAEEQEREIHLEMEVERHTERPQKVFPAMHVIHDDIRNFVSTGVLPEHRTYFIPLLTPTGIDGALNDPGLNPLPTWSPTPFATRDFAITTDDSKITDLKEYLRPVNWILSSGTGNRRVVIVISPYEANELLPVIRKSEKVRLHIYAARVTVSMRSFSDLGFYTIPKSPTMEWTAPGYLRTELDLFSGQLYFDNKEEYERLCVLLALHMVHPGAKHIEVDGFVSQAYRTGPSSPLTVSALATFKKLTMLRRKGTGFGGTDLGRVLDARPLSSEFASWMRKE